MENPTLTLTLHLDTLEMDIDAPEISLDFALSMIERAKRILDHQERVVVAQQMAQGVRAAQSNEERTRKVISNLKM